MPISSAAWKAAVSIGKTYETRWFQLRFLFRLGARDRVLSGESPLLSRAEPGRMSDNDAGRRQTFCGLSAPNAARRAVCGV